ncbi:Uu.00g135030.m01.CDS01 [Anthostomella pinea]|uniref:Uu.00g135030.m01.CDS01 n=1 Tax=Anthostomella pinea TaxID=933095 RepID=A0AAI8YKR7_9PEZI|nr:Uu.00g135030.m01.CDS01 [Anthostomella pinea]
MPIWGGQPGCGPEIMMMRHCDMQQLLQNMFVFDGDMLLVTDRDKNKAIRGIGHKVAWFLPAHVGKMLIAYITWVLPFEKMLYTQAGGAKGQWETAELSKQLAALAGQHIGVELTVADYRHVTIELGRKIRGLVIRQLEVDIGTAEQDDIRGGGGPGREDPVTGETREQQKTESIWDLSRRAYWGAGTWPAASSYYSIDENIKTREERKREREIGTVGGCPFKGILWSDPSPIGKYPLVMWEGLCRPSQDLQATHGSAIARQHYALDVRFPGQLQPQMIANYQEISRLWHGYLQPSGSGGDQGQDDDYKSASKDKKRQAKAADRGRGGDKDRNNRGGKKRKVGNDRSKPGATEKDGGKDNTDNSSNKESCETGIDNGLRRLLGIDACWKTEEQQAAMTKVMATKGRQALIVVLPTGGRKSILFMLPAVTEKTGTTVVMVLFIALMDDLAARARDFRVDSLRWQTAAQTGRDES